MNLFCRYTKVETYTGVECLNDLEGPVVLRGLTGPVQAEIKHVKACKVNNYTVTHMTRQLDTLPNELKTSCMYIPAGSKIVSMEGATYSKDGKHLWIANKGKESVNAVQITIPVSASIFVSVAGLSFPITLRGLKGRLPLILK